MLHYRTPDIDYQGLDDEEKNVLFTARLSLFDMASQTRHFAMAVALYDHCDAIIKAHKAQILARGKKPTPQEWRQDHERMEAPRAWQHIAARDAVMCIYHFWQAMEAVKENLKKCPTIDPKIDWSKCRAATDLMKKYFPGRDSMRQAIAHSAELTKTPKEFRKNSVDGPYASPDGSMQMKAGASEIYVGYMLNADTRRYQTMHRGTIHTCDITNDSLKSLEEIMVVFFSAFEALDPLSPHARQMRGTPGQPY